MRKTVVGLFDDAISVRVAQALRDSGFARSEVQLRKRMLGGSVHDLAELGIPRDEAVRYQDAMSRGATLVVVDASDADVPRAVEIMRRFDEPYAARDESRFENDASRTTETSLDAARRESIRSQSEHLGAASTLVDEPARALVDEKVIPVVEERLEIGKRDVDRGGARVSTRVVERPVEQDLELREEHVTVERVPTDRIAGADDFDTAREISLRERAERAVVAKTARVVEEVHVGKAIDTRTEHIHDTLKSTEVAVERLGERAAPGLGTGDGATRDHRAHFDRTYGRTPDARWESYEPAYRLGHELGGDRRYAGRDWALIERDARTRWEDRSPGTWERVKAAVRHAFDRARGGGSSVRHA